MKKLPDYSEYLTPAAILAEDIEWQKEQRYVEYARRVRDFLQNFKLRTVLEVGCGAGYVANELKLGADYLGIDGNAAMVALAQSKFPEQNFVHGNIRTLPVYEYDIVCCFAVLKHFSIEEFPEMLRRILACGHAGLFQIQVNLDGDSIDTGTAFHHTFISVPDLMAAIDAAGHCDWFQTHERLIATGGDGNHLVEWLVGTFRKGEW